MRSLKRISMSSSLRRLVALVLIGVVTAVSLFVVTASAQKRKPARHGTICGDPTAKCRTTATFQPHDLPFQVPASGAIFDTQLFYAIILKSANVPTDDCNQFISESERLAAQSLFPDHKVFSSRCAEPGELFYTNTSPKARFMAVYAGMSQADANRMLTMVKATGKFPSANIRRMRAGFNGT
jgi:hypothetical protein